jgi:hypothetical protein
MSPSGPADSSIADTTFLVGPSLVEFDRRDLPIYALLESQWADAGLDISAHGAPLDRLFGESGAVFVSDMSGTAESSAAIAAAGGPGDDPLVGLGGLSDGLIAPAAEPSGAPHATEIVTTFDTGSDSFTAVHLHDGGTWDTADGAWDFGHAT